MIEQQQQHAQQAASVAPALIAREKEAFGPASVDAAPVVSEPPLPPLPPPAPDKAPAVPTEIVQAESVPAETAATPVQTPPRPLSRLRGSIATVDSVGTAVVKQDIEMELADDASFRSSSTDSLGVPIASRFMSNSRASQRPPWQFDVVSIDDLTLSDTSSEVHASGPACPPGLRRAGQKRLPLRRDFEFVQRPESVSSMGLTSHRSVVSTTSSVVSAPSSVGLGGNIQQWQVNALVDSLSNDEESGDVEDALRRLEGQINPAKQQEKASKVDGWVRTIRERLAAGDYQDEPPRFMDDDDEEEEEEEEQSPKGFAEQEDVVEETGSQWSGDGLVASSSSISQSGSQSSQDLGPVDTADTSVASAPQAAHTFAPEPVSPVRATHAHLILEDVVPIEILESRLADRPQTFSGLAHPSDFGLLDISRIHRSFILSYRAEVLVEHFSMIDRELFMGVRFEELVSDEWMSCEEVDVLDWAQFLKDRARWKAEHRFPHKTSALAAVRARFNLIANFTVSEVVLTHPSDRAVVVAKLIRMAWVSPSREQRIPLAHLRVAAGVLFEQLQHPRRHYCWSSKRMGHQINASVLESRWHLGDAHVHRLEGVHHERRSLQAHPDGHRIDGRGQTPGTPLACPV
jgi:GDP/GTP exchange factor required for growth at low temperature